MFHQTYGLSLVTAPTFEPLSLDQVKLHLKVDTNDDDTLIRSLIIAAREYCENFLSRRLVTSTWDMMLDSFPGDQISQIEIPYPPLQSVTSITYLDSAGVSTILSTSLYGVDVARFKGRVYPAFSQIWPVTRFIQAAVTIRYVAGFGTAQAVPESIKAAMKLVIGNWYENRESTIAGTIINTVPAALEHLLWSQRVLEP